MSKNLPTGSDKTFTPELVTMHQMSPLIQAGYSAEKALPAMRINGECRKVSAMDATEEMKKQLDLIEAGNLRQCREMLYSHAVVCNQIFNVQIQRAASGTLEPSSEKSAMDCAFIAAEICRQSLESLVKLPAASQNRA